MIKQTTFPDVTDIISLAQVKNHLRVEHDDDDDLITTFMAAARDMVEGYTGAALDETEFEVYFDHVHEYTNIHVGPGVRVNTSLESLGVTYEDTNGSRQRMALTDYEFDGSSYPARLQILEIPNDIGDNVNTWRIDVIAGYSDGARPKALTAALLLIVGSLYENRQDVSTLRTYETPLASRHLMNPFRLKSFS